MIRYFIIAIGLYLVFLACYLVWERSVKRKRNAGKKPALRPFRAAPKEDIIGKSTFTLRHSRPQASTLEISEKREENAPIFAHGNAGNEAQNTPAADPISDADEVYPLHFEGDDSGEIEINDEEPEGEYESEEWEEVIDFQESEEAEEAAGVSMAQGVSFDDLSGMVQTVDNAEAATGEEREEAGRVLVEVRMTKLFEQIVAGEPKKKQVAGKLMDDYFAAWNRRQSEAQPEPHVKAPTDFDVRAFA